MTWLMVGTSMPRAATSVATSTFRSPRRRPISTRLRLPCGIAPCSGATAWPISARRSASQSASRWVLVKTTAWSSSGAARMDSSSWSLWWGLSAQCRRCSMFSCVSVCEATSMRWGSFSSCCARRPTWPAKVALNITVCLVPGVWLVTTLMSSMKPMSSMRSASSSTSISTLLSTHLPLARWSSRRPGVAISTSTPALSAAVCGFMSTPPKTTTERRLVCLAYFLTLSATWSASSRVGASTSARTG
mmetsp:Transcript_1230/g.3417  ORF Transcript_1230/g.3417 Transcript_1230/m.3417 type:complete len:246 (+) Transcript_1230:1297-2034(+)